MPARPGGKGNAWFMTLSGGQKRRLFIALALIHEPELVFLDELTTGLDPQARRTISWELVTGIRDRGTTVFLTTHLMEEAERLRPRGDPRARTDHRSGHARGAGAPALSRTVGRLHQRRRRRPRPDAGAGRGRAAPGDGVTYTLRGAGDDFVTEVIHRIAREGVRVRGFRTEIPTSKRSS